MGLAGVERSDDAVVIVRATGREQRRDDRDEQPKAI